MTTTDQWRWNAPSWLANTKNESPQLKYFQKKSKLLYNNDMGFNTKKYGSSLKVVR